MQPFPTREGTFEAFARHVSRGKVDVYRQYGVDVIMGAREGIWFEDAFDGRRFINCHSNGGVFNLGHRNPAVISAVVRALETVDIGNHHLVSGHRASLARRLVETTDGRLEGVVFGVSGGEAVDLAIKAARGATGRAGIVSFSGGYHGHTGLALAAGDAQYRDPFGPPLPCFSQVPFEDLPAMDAAISDDTAAVLLEPIPATLGMPLPSAGFLSGVEGLCRKRGALLIVDEVQTGLGRTGTLWAHEQDDIEPDILVTGKGLGGGVYPITATLMTRAVHAVFDERPFAHISTFGGAEPGCAAALAVLDAIAAPGFLAHVRSLSDRIAAGLEGAPFKIRRRGLFMGLVLPMPDGGKVAARALFDAGVFALYANHDTSVVQFLPPLIMTDDEADELVRRVRSVFG